MKKILTLFLAILALNVSSQCTSNSSLYPSTTFTPNCNGTSQNITTAGFATEYSMIYVTSGQTYTFSSSISSDYLTIANSAGGAPVYAFGTTPVIWTATFTGNVRMYNNTSGPAACGTNMSIRTRSILCGTPPMIIQRDQFHYLLEHHVHIQLIQMQEPHHQLVVQYQHQDVHPIQAQTFGFQ